MARNNTYQQFNCYKVLNISDYFCDPQEIKSAYRRISLQVHPDVGGSIEAQIKVNLAYEILRDPIERQAHDIFWKINQKPEAKNSYQKDNKPSNHNSSHSRDQKSEPLSGLRKRFFEEISLTKSIILKDEDRRYQLHKIKYEKLFTDSKKLIVFQFLGLIISTILAFSSQLIILYLITLFCAWGIFNKLNGISIEGRTFSIFDSSALKKIQDHAKQSAKNSCESDVKNLDSYLGGLASLSELLIRSSNFDDSEEQVARRLTAAFFIMGYSPVEYYIDGRILVFTDGEEKIVVRFRHRMGQALNITYVEKLVSFMKFSKASKGFIFCSPGLSGNAALYAYKCGVKAYSLEEMNIWIENVLTSNYSGPPGKIIDNIEKLKSFFSKFSFRVSGPSYRRRRRY